MINRKWVQTKKTQLYTSIGSTATSILLKNAFKLDGSLLDMEDDFGAIGFMTLEPGGLKEEIISFTGLSYNLSGTILTLSGVTRGLSGSSAYGSGGVAYGHSANRVAIFTNNPQHYEGFANKYNEETITQVWTFTETERPKLDVDRDALLAEEFITLGQANRLIQATYLPPQIVASDSGTTGNVQASSLTISHTIPATIENGGTFVVINTEENKTVSTVTLGGVALTQVATKTRVTGNIRVEIWRLIAPASGTANLVITPSANAYITAHVISLSNVNQTTPEDALSTGADGSGTAVADSVTTTTQGAVILMGVGTANDPTTFTPTAPLAEQEVNSASTDRPLSSSVRSTTTAGVYALAYTIAPSTNWVTKAVAIRGIAVPGIAGVSSVTGNYIDNTDPANPVSEVPLNNTTTTNPTVNDDESIGYYVDSKWYNSSTGVLWTCTDATNGAAVWVQVTNGNSGASSTITLTAGETINGATNPVPVFMGTNIDVAVIDRLFTDNNWTDSEWDTYSSAPASGSTYTWNQNTKYAYKISGDRVYDIFNLVGLRRQGIQGNNVNYTINIYNTGVAEPTGTPIATRSISTTYPGSGTGNYNQYIALSAEVDCTPVLSGGNNYWLELVIGTITPGASTDIETFTRTLLSGGDYLAWNGSAWVASNVPAVQLIGVPNAGYVYRNNGDIGFQSLESLDSPIDQHDVSRGHFVGFVTSNVVKGDPVVVTTDGIVTFTTPFSTSGGAYYVVPDSTIGTVTIVDAFSQPLGSFTTPGANTVGLLATDTKLKIFRNGRNSVETFYQ